MTFSSTQSDVDQLQRLTALEYILLGDLRDILEEEPTQTTRHWLETILDALLETLPQEFKLREEGGYLQEVVEIYPHWENQVSQLQTEHIMLVRRLQELRRSLIRHASFRSQIISLKEELQLWMHALNAHHRHENRLVQEVINTQYGAVD